ncbi:hypothetical protein [Hyphomicrobium sp. MC8b]|uniref:hypothetical protein n=2 Tax=unclassified Hyphomicrobium TaxID=2619925 RepID=UPI00391D55F9
MPATWRGKMADKKETLKGLATLFGGGGRVRRVDYKGPRRRLNLRLPGQVLRDLRIIKHITGEDQNTFCVRKLEEAIAKVKEDLKAQHDPATWDTIVGFIDRNRR